MELEKDIEKYLRLKVREVGGECWKLTSPGTVGVPDRVVIANKQIVFVELKRQNGRVAAMQKYQQMKLKALGAHVKVIRTKKGVDHFIKSLKLGHYEGAYAGDV